MFPVECVVRGYLVGSGWAEYQQSGSVCGVALPAGLQNGDRLPEPIYTPAYKAPQGEHDENISYEQTVELVGEDVAVQLRDLSLRVYSEAAAIALERGVVIADTKFEFGRDASGQIRIADEVLTSDSSRYWDARSGNARSRSTSRSCATGSARTGTGRAHPPCCPRRSSPGRRALPRAHRAPRRRAQGSGLRATTTSDL